jgi:hypothetical protein
MTKRVFNGPQDRQPKTITNRTCSAALLPATFVTIGASTVSQATAPNTSRIGLLSDRDWYSTSQFDANDPLKVAYASGDTATVYELEPAQRYSVAMAAGTYTNGQELTVAAAGRLAAAATTNVVVAYYDGPGATLAAGDIADVAIANFYTKA